ncbi:MAG TPA: hypothetical protein VJ044_02555 [Candidatus Hodarchaeales archaeon]|nr:hypothetical protein [Candidatus Hodarchaeales archaeon]
MKRIKTGTKGPRGEAKVRVGNGKVQIIFKEDKDNPITLQRVDLPDYVKPGTFYVSLSGEGEFLGMRPTTALVRAKFVHFVAEEGEVPAPREYPGGSSVRKSDNKPFSWEPYMAFIAVLEITDKEYKGMQIPVFLRYLFVDDGEGNVAIKGGGKNAELLESFLEVTSVYDDDLPFSENVLPKLQKRLLKKGAEFVVMLKSGNVDSFSEIPEDDEDNSDFDNDDDLPAPDGDKEPPWEDDDDD